MVISYTPEMFQQCNNKVFDDIPNVHITYDNVITVAADNAEHDTALRDLFTKAQLTVYNSTRASCA